LIFNNLFFIENEIIELINVSLTFLFNFSKLYMNPLIFISYRREDSEWATDLLFERLAKIIGPDAIFQDVNTISPGENFPESTKRALTNCSVVLVVIGEGWLGAKNQGSEEQTKKPSNWVRTEIEIAIKRKKCIIPVIIFPASIPSAEDLPKSIASIISLQAVKLYPGSDFDLGFSKLLNAIIDSLPQAEQRNVNARLRHLQTETKQASKFTPWNRLFISIILLLALCLLISFVFLGKTVTNSALIADRNAAAVEFKTQIEEWFTNQFERLEETARLPELRSNNLDEHRKTIINLATSGDFPGGIYTLDSKGIVIAQATPNYPNMKPLSGEDYSGREYFKECQRQMGPVTTHAFLSGGGNRNKQIVVLAVPRTNDNGLFIGILNGVVDLDSSSLTAFAVETVSSRQESNVNLFLVDSMGVVLASNIKKDVAKPFSNVGVIMRYKSNKLTETDKLDFLVLPVDKTPYFILARFG